MSQRDRRGCDYDAYLADSLADRNLSNRGRHRPRQVSQQTDRPIQGANNRRNDALAEAGILRQRNIGRQRYRVFEATEALDLFADLERALATPKTNARRSGRPVRRVPKPHRSR